MAATKVIDIRRELVKRLEKSAKDDTKNKYYAFDISEVKVSFVSISYKNLKRKCTTLTLDTATYTNCTANDQEYVKVFKKSRLETAKWTFSSTISWGAEVSAGVSVPSGVSVGGKTTFGINFTAGKESSVTEVKEHKEEVKVTVPGCGNRVDMTFKFDECVLSGDVEVKLRASGEAKAKIDVDWWPDPKVSVFVNEDFVITGKFDGVYGINTDVTLNQFTAECEEGSVCKLKRKGGGAGQEKIPEKDESKETPEEDESEESKGAGESEEEKEQSDSTSGGTSSTEARRPLWNTPQNVDTIARVMVSADPTGNRTVWRAVANVCCNNMRLNQTSNASDVVGDYTLSREPNPAALRTAEQVINGKLSDNTSGATVLYCQPLCTKEPAATGDLTLVNVRGTSKSGIKFYRTPGKGKVK